MAAMTPEQRQQRDDRIAGMLRAGATYAQIQDELGARSDTIARVRRTRGIPVPESRRLDPAHKAAVEARVVELLTGGATYEEVRAEVGLSYPTIGKIRNRAAVDTPFRKGHRRTVRQAYALYTREDGDHLLWTGPRSGTRPVLTAGNEHHNPRAIAFRRHHRRDPEGRLWRTCDEPQCIAGAHHTDETLRAARDTGTTPASGLDLDALYDAIFTTPGDTP
ncbi:hypothetical protein ABZX77_40635 [Streptomyces sp. NPDC004237]|uniref:hypothetical protein n=1 Tax=Streptomyces sp. NPDC004237 TaxID=3154455 RepID=UPI0033BCD7A5